MAQAEFVCCLNSVAVESPLEKRNKLSGEANLENPLRADLWRGVPAGQDDAGYLV